MMNMMIGALCAIWTAVGLLVGGWMLKTYFGREKRAIKYAIAACCEWLIGTGIIVVSIIGG